MKFILTLTLILMCFFGFGQSVITWSSDYELKLSDFQSPQTEINKKLSSYSIFSGINLDFAFDMSAYKFIVTKNFNDKVKTTFNKNAAIITASDSIIANFLVKFVQYNFDLTELYARKFRKELYEKKGAFSSTNFFKPIFEKLQEEMNLESSRVLKATDLGKNEELLALEHDKVLLEIQTYSDYCLKCKPPKNRRKKNN